MAIGGGKPISASSLYGPGSYPGSGTSPSTLTGIGPSHGYPTTNVNLQVDPHVLQQLGRIAVALEKIVEKMGHGFD